MLDMDKGGEAASWVGCLFRKFENLCCDMDGVVRQEIGHIVEHQFQNLGAKVAKICSNMDEEVSGLLEEEKESNIDIVDSGASNIGIDEDHHKKKDSCDANKSLSSCFVQLFEKAEIEPSVEQHIDSRTDENLGVTDEEIRLLLEEEKSASKGNNLYDMWESDARDDLLDRETILEYLSRGFSIDSTTADTAKSDLPDSTTARMSEDENDIEMTETLVSFQAIYDDIDEAILVDNADDDISVERTLTMGERNKRKKRKVVIIRSGSSKEANHESNPAGHEFPVEVIQKAEESETNPEFDWAEVVQILEEVNTNQDSDWVIV